ncbi:hypothetical protein DLJ96_12250, partial [Actinotalea fermentans ATCC 43279 = JCM 9966 = DSM 3133]
MTTPSAPALVPSGAAPTAFPLTTAQLGVIGAQLVRPGTTAFAVGEVVEITGDVDTGVLALAVELVAGETEALRTAFVVSDDVAQVVHPAGGPALTRARADAATGGVRVLDLSGVPEARERAAALVETDRAL